MNVAFDEFGQPFILMRQQNEMGRLRGMEAYKSNLLAARAISDVLKTSLGPRGNDKIITDPDGQITVTNDGATILNKMEVSYELELNNNKTKY